MAGKIYTFESGLAHWRLPLTDIHIVFHTPLHNDHCEDDYKVIRYSRKPDESNNTIR